VTFTYAGLQKLTNRYFFDAANPGSIEAQLHASITTSPVGALLRLSAHDPVLVGLLIAFGEVAVGLGTLFGLFGRVAAAGGMALSFVLFLSVSFQHHPVLLRSGHRLLLCLDPTRGRRMRSLVCRRRPRDTSRQGAGRGWGGAGPASTGPGPPGSDSQGGLRSHACELRRRHCRNLGSNRENVRRHLGPELWSSQTHTTGHRIGRRRCLEGTAIGLVSAVPLGTARQSRTGPGIPAYVVRPSESSYVGFSAVCTHMAVS